jgi:hypothetical protein
MHENHGYGIWTFTGSAIRVAQCMNLLQDNEFRDQVDQDTRRRVWWNLYDLERYPMTLHVLRLDSSLQIYPFRLPSLMNPSTSHSQLTSSPRHTGSMPNRVVRPSEHLHQDTRIVQSLYLKSSVAQQRISRNQPSRSILSSTISVNYKNGPTLFWNRSNNLTCFPCTQNTTISLPYDGEMQ